MPPCRFSGMYAASKHAVKGFTDALRIEVERIDQAPVSITLIQPTAVDTPFDQHARNYMDKEPKLPDPQDKPEDVAEAILLCVTLPERTVIEEIVISPTRSRDQSKEIAIARDAGAPPGAR